MHPIRSPWSKAGLKFQQKQWKTHTHGSLTILSSMITWARKRKRDIKGFLEFNKNEPTIYPNLWDTMKAVVRGKLIALSTSKKRLERVYTSSLKGHLKALERKEGNSCKSSRWQEIIKLRTEINQVETKRTIQKWTKPEAGSLRKSIRYINP